MSAPPPPSIRRATATDATGIARVQVDTWRSTYRGIIADAYLASLDYGQRTARWTQILTPPSVSSTFVAEADSEIVGFSGCGPNRDASEAYTGELYAVYVLAEHHGRGIGAALVQRAAAQLWNSGSHSMIVWVFPDNPACGFYARLGGVPRGAKEIEIGGESYREVAYGWDDLEALVAEKG